MEVHDFGLQKARGATRHDLVTSRYKKKAETKGAASSSGYHADQREESRESYMGEIGRFRD